jgi:hypothetical protein
MNQNGTTEAIEMSRKKNREGKKADKQNARNIGLYGAFFTQRDIVSRITDNCPQDARCATTSIRATGKNSRPPRIASIFHESVDLKISARHDIDVMCEDNCALSRLLSILFFLQTARSNTTD